MREAEPSAGYRLVRELGRGGMGVVHEAEDVASGRRVALKILSRELLDSEQAAQRFRREARLAASITHPNTVFVFGVAEVDGAPAIAMELMSGETLEDRLRAGGTIPVEQSVAWMLDVLDGLEAASKAGVIHRDVKPGNCYLTRDGRVKVGDFGLSRPVDTEVALTRQGAFLGTPLYASPEQLRGDKLNLRSDLYSAGATLYALLCGRPPIQGDSVGEVIARVLSTPPAPPRSLRPDVPGGLEKAVLRALAKDPKDRFADHAELRRALEPYALGAAKPGTLGRRFLAFLLDGALVGAVEAATGVAVGVSITDETQAAALFFFAVAWAYFALCEGLTGATLGKYLVGLRVVAASTGQPALVRACGRAGVFFAADPNTWIAFGAPMWFQWASPLACLLLFVTAHRRNGYRAVHELVSGTRTVAVAPAARRRAPPALDPHRSPVKDPATIGEYAVTRFVATTPSGRLFSADDATLARSVWLHVFNRPEGAPPPATQSAEDGVPLRLIGSVRRAELAYDVYEDPGGASVPENLAAGRRMEWPEASRELRRLAAHFDGADAPVSVDQVWIDRSGAVRVLDFPATAQARPPLAPTVALRETASAMLLGAPSAGLRLPPDLPLHAEPAARRLLGGPPFATAGDARAALDEAAAPPAYATAAMRAGQVAVAILPALLACLGIAFAIGEIDAESRELLATFLPEASPEQRIEVRHATVRALCLYSSGMVALFLGLPITVLAFTLRGGLTFSLFGLALRDRRGERASRLRCSVRSLFVWAPITLAIALVSIDTTATRILGVAIAVASAFAFVDWSNSGRNDGAPAAAPVKAKKARKGLLGGSGAIWGAWFLFKLSMKLVGKGRFTGLLPGSFYLAAGVAGVWLVGAVVTVLQPRRGPLDRLCGTHVVTR